MSAALNNITAPDNYTAGSTLACPKTARVRLVVNNNSIYWRRGRQPAGGGGIFYEAEEFLLPGVYSLDEICEVVQIRAAIAAAKLTSEEKVAQVTVTTRTAEELA